MRSLYESILSTDTEVTNESERAVLVVKVKTAIESVFGKLVPDQGKYARKNLIGEVSDTYFNLYHTAKLNWNFVYRDIEKIFKTLKKEGISTKCEQSKYHYSDVDTYKCYITFYMNDIDVEIKIEADSTKYGIDTISVWTYDKYNKYFL